jgi:TonB family protein
MRQLRDTVLDPAPGPAMRELQFLLLPDSRVHNFVQNFRELFRTREPIDREDAAAFWHDVFVRRKLPWLGFLQSLVYHVLALALILVGSRFFASLPRAVVEPRLTHADVIYYTPAEYLPPIDTRQFSAARREKPDSGFSPQPIISLPPEAENHSQTVVTPPRLRLRHDLPLPNIVAWSAQPQMPIGPTPMVLASDTSRITPQLDQPVIAPPPDGMNRMQAKSSETLSGPETAIIAPPPEVNTESPRGIGALDIGQSRVIAPAPQLSLDEQRSIGTAIPMGTRPVQVIAPPPTVSTSAGRVSGANMIALSLHPAVKAPAEPVSGSRRGSFATTPEGHSGGSGAAGTRGGNDKGNGAASAGTSTANLPPGLYVGKSSNPPSAVGHGGASTSPIADSVNPRLLADVRPPRISAHTLQPESDSKLAEEERSVFGSRKFYSLSLNMPNLNSAGGSWVIRFAALKADPGSEDAYARAAAANAEGASQDNLSAPSATRKVDPAYPLELMRQNVAGTVILYGVIRSDGTVDDVRVLRSVDERLDRYAAAAIAKWKFEPARKDGKPVDVEATFWIPFKPSRTNAGF